MQKQNCAGVLIKWTKCSVSITVSEPLVKEGFKDLKNFIVGNKSSVVNRVDNFEETTEIINQIIKSGTGMLWDIGNILTKLIRQHKSADN